MNQIIHFIFIPTIVFCVFNLGHYWTIYELKTTPDMTVLKIDISVILLTCVFPVYLMIDKLTGLISVVFYSAAYCYSIDLFKQYQGKEVAFGVDHFWFFVYLKAAAWIFQFIGHGVFERRAPALLSNILTTLVAPDFVFIELMYYIFGWNKKAINLANVEIEADIKQFRAKKGGKPNIPSPNKKKEKKK